MGFCALDAFELLFIHAAAYAWIQAVLYEIFAVQVAHIAEKDVKSFYIKDPG
jgi:hypothetical protein